MPKNMLDYDTGYDAYNMGEPFDADKPKDWQDGYFDAATDDVDCDA